MCIEKIIDAKFSHMKIEKIIIDGFKCFKHYEVSLCPKANVLIGRNGAGKTTLVHAITKALSFVFSNDKSLGKDFLSSGNNTLNVRGYNTSDFHFDENKREYSHDVRIKAHGCFAGETLGWELYKRNSPGASLYPSLYKNAFVKFMTATKTKNCEWPLLAYYSDSYPHVYSKVTSQTLDTINQDIIPRNFGYYQWDYESACTSLWETRLCGRLAKMQPLFTPVSRLSAAINEKEEASNLEALQKDEEYSRLKKELERVNNAFAPLHDEVSYIEQKLSLFISHLPKIQNEGYGIDYFFASQSDEGYKLSINFKNGKSILLQDLPAGYRRLFSIVMDMAYRSYILNQGKEAKGIAIIDEIDLHLHPALEQVVLEAFLKTFPQMQYIVSTHSAAVISNLDTSTEVISGKENRNCQILVMSMNEDHPQVLPNLLGVDYNAVMRDFMETPSRNEDLRHLEDLYFTYLSMELKKESQTIYEKIVSLVGKDAKILEEIRAKAAEYGVY